MGNNAVAWTAEAYFSLLGRSLKVRIQQISNVRANTMMIFLVFPSRLQDGPWSKHHAWSKHHVCWPEVNRQPDISPTMMGLFRIHRGLRFGFGNHGWAMCKTLHGKERGMLSEWRNQSCKLEGYSKQWASGFSLGESSPGGKSFFFLLLSYHHRLGSLPVLVSRLLFNWGFCLLIICMFTARQSEERRLQPLLPFLSK